ncbi:cupin domain-containing protein [Rhizomonospora bruguierae]|uniref:cupin domain-containing protein n=1 Tax=Rhizomonospora bruguierae TaxID=1581705 RepID=UPI001BD00C41|nr:cupin domain-containing protein [Micromonospora sp. NBRC 107566]
MKIVHGRAEGIPSEQRATVTGEAWFDPVLPATDGTTIATVFFAPGARTYWHRHENGQVLQVLAGRGLICTDGEQPRTISAGDTVWVPPGERHWHGAATDSFMTHTAISLGTTHWAEEVVSDG